MLQMHLIALSPQMATTGFNWVSLGIILVMWLCLFLIFCFFQSAAATRQTIFHWDQ